MDEKITIQINIMIPNKTSTTCESESGFSEISARVPAFLENPIRLFS